MAQAFAVDERIDAPVPQVWETLTDWSRAPEWMKGVDRLSADGPTEVGTTLTFTARGKDRTSEIVEVTPGRAVTLRSTQGKVVADYRYRCRADGEATRVELVADCRTDGPLMTVLGPLLRYVIRRTDGGQLRALRQLVEREGRAA